MADTVYKDPIAGPISKIETRQLLDEYLAGFTECLNTGDPRRMNTAEAKIIALMEHG